ncbi:isopropylmalate isomerase small subunit [Vibrio cholerae]|nr:isopropylmalate isomerase small subunit [Vibrio cholerae]
MPVRLTEQEVDELFTYVHDTEGLSLCRSNKGR